MERKEIGDSEHSFLTFMKETEAYLFLYVAKCMRMCLEGGMEEGEIEAAIELAFSHYSDRHDARTENLIRGSMYSLPVLHTFIKAVDHEQYSSDTWQVIFMRAGH